MAIAAREVCSSPTDNARGLRKAKLRQQRRAGLASLILSHVSFLMLINDCVGRPRPGVQIAKAAITSNYIRNDSSTVRYLLAVPVSIFSDAIDCAPGGVAISSAGRSFEPCCRHNNNQTNYQLARVFATVFATTMPLRFRVSSLNQHRNEKINPGRRHLKAKGKETKPARRRAAAPFPARHRLFSARAPRQRLPRRARAR